MRKLTVILLLLTLVACGSHVKITIHEVQQSEIDGRTNSTGRYAHTDWKDYGFETLCDIYIKNSTEYPCEKFYESVLRHEKRHCYEGHFHPAGQATNDLEFCE